MFECLDRSEIKRPLRVNSVIGIDGSLLVLAKHCFILAMVVSCETQGVGTMLDIGELTRPDIAIPRL